MSLHLARRWVKLGATALAVSLLWTAMPARSATAAGSCTGPWCSPGSPTPVFPWQPWPSPGWPTQPDPGQPTQPDPGQPGQPDPGQPGQPDPGQPGQGTSSFPDGFPQGFVVPNSSETGRSVGGWGCDSTGQTDGGQLKHTPVLFVHGSTRDAHDWDAVRQTYLEHGYSLCETWALSYGRDSMQNPDSNEASYRTIGDFVAAMKQYFKQYKGVDVQKIDIVTHSLGGTVVRRWLQADNAYDQVDALVEIAGPNHGLGNCPGGEGCAELQPGGSYLQRLNAGGETPGSIRYLTAYDGTGQYDYFYQGNLKDSPALQGAENHPFNVEHGTSFDHEGLINGTVDLQLQWLQKDW